MRFVIPVSGFRVRCFKFKKLRKKCVKIAANIHSGFSDQVNNPEIIEIQHLLKTKSLLESGHRLEAIVIILVSVISILTFRVYYLSYWLVLS